MAKKYFNVDLETSGDMNAVDVTASGNISAVDVTATGNVSAGTFSTETIQTEGQGILFKDDNGATIAELKETGDWESSSITLSNNNARITSAGNITAVDITATGDMNAVDVTASGNISATGNVSTVDVNATGNVKVLTGNVYAVDITATGDVSAVDVAASGDVTITSGQLKVVNGAFVTAKITNAGDITAVDVTAAGDVSAVDVIATGDMSAVDITATGAISTTSGDISTDTGHFTSTGGDITTGTGFIKTTNGGSIYAGAGGDIYTNHVNGDIYTNAGGDIYSKGGGIYTEDGEIRVIDTTANNNEVVKLTTTGIYTDGVIQCVAGLQVTTGTTTLQGPLTLNTNAGGILDDSVGEGQDLDYHYLGVYQNNGQVRWDLSGKFFSQGHIYKTPVSITPGTAVCLSAGGVIPSSSANSTTVVGIVARSKECTTESPTDTSLGETITEGFVVKVASVGDSRYKNCTGFNVCNEAGAINPGDLLVTSSTAGYLMKQDDDIIRSKTVGKAMEAVTFDANGQATGIYGYIYCG